jgi:murein DD-endopeptidase MepM/ murein hydrolase activator NlpD
LAEENDSTELVPDESGRGVIPTRRGLRAASTRPQTPARPQTRRVARRPAPAAKRKSPARRFAVVSVIVALVGTVSIPAFAAATSGPEPRTIQQAAFDDAQSLVVASHDQPATLSRSSYSATTSAEISKKEAQEAAAARARKAAAAAAAASYSSVRLNLTGPGTGAIRWPLAKVDHIGDGFGTRGGEHQGVDLLDAGGTPIFAATSGTVNVSSESYYGYGVAVTIDTVIGGQKVTTLYGHMRYGSRQVTSGQKVQVGQVIGLVGSTGRSTANHLHFEVMINGTHVDPLAWLRANAG